MQISPKCCIVSAPLSAAAFALKCKAAQFYVSTRKHLQKQRPLAATYLCRFAAKARFDNRPNPRVRFPKGRAAALPFGRFKGKRFLRKGGNRNPPFLKPFFGYFLSGKKVTRRRQKKSEKPPGGQLRPPLPPPTKHTNAKKRPPPGGLFSLSINPLYGVRGSFAQGELEGAKPASNWIKCRAKPCLARRAWSTPRVLASRREATIFVPQGGTKITTLFQAVEKPKAFSTA